MEKKILTTKKGNSSSFKSSNGNNNNGNRYSDAEIRAAEILLSTKGRKPLSTKYHRDFDFEDVLALVRKAKTLSETLKMITSVIKACNQENGMGKLVNMLRKEWKKVSDEKYFDIEITEASILSEIMLLVDQNNNPTDEEVDGVVSTITRDVETIAMYNIELALNITQAIHNNTTKEFRYGSVLYNIVNEFKLRNEYKEAIADGNQEKLDRLVLSKNGVKVEDNTTPEVVEYLFTGEGGYRVDELKFFNKRISKM